MTTQANLESCRVSDHAVAQFQGRIARLDDMSARRVIRDGIQGAENIRSLPDGNTLRVRTRRPFPFEFRAYCVFDYDRGHFVVTTIVRGDSNVTRAHRRKVSADVNPAGRVSGE
jgi:hypothetical protein